MGGRKIDDHSFWAGGKSRGSVFPEGVHTRDYNSAEGAGELKQYEDTTEAIKTQQEMGKKKINSLPQRPHHRY
jgi:hypothetical protein